VFAGGVEVYTPGEGVRHVSGPWTSRTIVAHRLVQTLHEYKPGTSDSRLAPGIEEVLYVVSGDGTCIMDGMRYALRPGTGVFLPPGVVSTIENAGPELLVIVSVACRASPEPVTADNARLTVHESERESIRASKDREFRLLVTTDMGSRQLTQFLGWVTTSKAPFHHHTYEEVIFILDGHGILHLKDHPSVSEFGPGASIYLPAGVVHRLENPGRTPIRLLGVFHPCGSPGVAYDDE
jgi:mannose-6-phosphate isomerase-like protein (cupin superfamily)